MTWTWYNFNKSIFVLIDNLINGDLLTGLWLENIMTRWTLEQVVIFIETKYIYNLNYTGICWHNLTVSSGVREVPIRFEINSKYNLYEIDSTDL